MKNIVLESPYAGNIERNLAYARKCLRWSLENDEAPFAGHMLYTQVWDDNDEVLRNAGIAAHCSWIAKADYVVMYVDYGISHGMREAEKTAVAMGVPVMRRSIGGV